MVRCAKKTQFSKRFPHCYRNDSFECFFTEKKPWSFRVNIRKMTYLSRKKIVNP